MTEEEKVRVQELVTAGLHPRQGFTLLRRKFPESLATAKNVYDAKAQSLLKELLRRSMKQAIIDKLTSRTLAYSV